MQLNRREFTKLTLSGAAALAASRADVVMAAGEPAPRKLKPKADSVIFIWLPGGVAQADTWDPKQYTPFEPGMKGSELLGTCESIPTKVDGLRIGEGLENMAAVMHHGTVLRSLTNETKFGAVHLKAQYYMMTGYLFPVGVKAPSIGAAVARTLGLRLVGNESGKVRAICSVEFVFVQAGSIWVDGFRVVEAPIWPATRGGVLFVPNL